MKNWTATDVPCDYCGAPIGVRCRTTGTHRRRRPAGTWTSEPHGVRLRRSSAKRRALEKMKEQR